MEAMIRAASPRAPRPMPVRRVDLAYTATRYWFGGNPQVTHVMNALSAAFPEGEKFFMDSVAHYRKRITDPALRQEVARFLGQEAAHTREHVAFNAWLAENGVETKHLEESVVLFLLNRGRTLPPRAQLAVTCALEHFTSLLAEQLLEHPELLEKFEPSIRKLWAWHAIEESEHKSVAFDVYEATGGTYATRVAVMAGVTVFFLLAINHMKNDLVRRDPGAQGFRHWLSGIDVMWGREGWFRRLIPGYLDYFRPGFHPWDRDSSALLKRARAALGFDPEGREAHARAA